jgi:hypothetical protein
MHEVTQMTRIYFPEKLIEYLEFQRDFMWQNFTNIDNQSESLTELVYKTHKVPRVIISSFSCSLSLLLTSCCNSSHTLSPSSLFLFSKSCEMIFEKRIQEDVVLHSKVRQYRTWETSKSLDQQRD